MNERDAKLIEFCKGRPKTIKEISEHLGIAVKNVHIKIEGLKDQGLIEVRKSHIAKVLVVQTKQDNEFNQELVRILKIIQDNKGGMEKQELFDKAYKDIEAFSPQGYLVNRVLLMLPLYEGIQEKFELNPLGTEFLKTYIRGKKAD